MASTMLIGHVRGRAYSANRLTQWVREIWGGLLKELHEVHVLPRVWFSLHFKKENYTDLVLARYWHIEMDLVLLKQWSPLFDPEREQIRQDHFGFACQGSHYSTGARKSSLELEMLWAHIWTMTIPL